MKYLSRKTSGNKIKSPIKNRGPFIKSIYGERKMDKVQELVEINLALEEQFKIIERRIVALESWRTEMNLKLDLINEKS